jgi:hypothetical protein
LLLAMAETAPGSPSSESQEPQMDENVINSPMNTDLEKQTDVPAVKGLNESRIELLARVQNLKKVVISLPLQVQCKMLSVEDFEQSESKSVASCVLCYQPLQSLSVYYSLLDLLSATCYNMVGAIRCLTL